MSCSWTEIELAEHAKYRAEFRKNDAKAQIKMNATFDRAIARAKEDDEKRGGLTPYLFSLTPAQRAEFAAAIRADLAKINFE